MNTQKMLTEMCHDILTMSDIGAICKIRSFSDKEAASRAVFENFFLSNIGIETALASLSDDEVALLHLLKFEEVVEISFFERLYGGKKPDTSYKTATQRYTPIFKTVYRDLVRKGILLIATAPDRSGKMPKMEKWRFQFPQVFAKFLPPLFRKTLQFKGKGNVKQDILRKKVLGIMKPDELLPFDNVRRYHLCLKQGELLIGDKPFSVERLLAWQQIYWHDYEWGAIQQKKPKKIVFTQEDLAASKIERNEFPPLITGALATLAPNQWVSPTALSNLLRFFYYGTTPPDSKSVCDTGWQLGCLAKHTEKGKDYYRLPPTLQTEDSDASNANDYLTVNDDGTLEVNIKRIPYDSLVHLAAISDLQVAATHLLKATPHFIRMGNAKEEVWNHPLTTWIKENSSAYQKVMAQITTRRGKHIIHENLLLACVKDLSLKVQIQKTFADSTSVVFLPNDFIAFPWDFFNDIQKLVNKSGYVIKSVSS